MKNIQSSAKLSVSYEPVKLGNTTTLSCTSNMQNATYQWQVRRDNGKTWTNIIDATSLTLKVSATESNLGSFYRLCATASGQVAYSNAVMLTAMVDDGPRDAGGNETVSLDDCTIVYDASKMTYNGKTQKPWFEVYANGTAGLIAGTDYSVTYLNSKKKAIKASQVVNAGTYYVKVSGKGRYTGSKTIDFTIAKKAGTLKVAAKAATAKKAVAVKAGKAVAAKRYAKVTKGASRTAPTFAKASKAGGAKIKVNAKTGKITVKKGCKPGLYTLKVKVASKASTNYKAAAKTITVKLRVK